MKKTLKQNNLIISIVLYVVAGILTSSTTYRKG